MAGRLDRHDRPVQVAQCGLPSVVPGKSLPCAAFGRRQHSRARRRATPGPDAAGPARPRSAVDL